MRVPRFSRPYEVSHPNPELPGKRAQALSWVQNPAGTVSQAHWACRGVACYRGRVGECGNTGLKWG